MRECALTTFMLVLVSASSLNAQSRIVYGSVDTDLVPGPVEYAVLLPEGYGEGTEPFPLILNLHGGGGDREWLALTKPSYDDLWADGSLPPVVVATPSAGTSGYLNSADGTARWEDFIVDELLAHLRQAYRVRSDRQGTLVTGVSMGGQGSFLLGLKHPHVFGALAAVEGGAFPVLTRAEVKPKHLFFLPPEMRADWLSGPDHFAANNPPSIVMADPERIRDSGLQIYLEVGDLDALWLYEGVEFLHKVLWDARIPHEYHLVRGADHVGPTLGPRFLEAQRFLGRVLVPPPPDPGVDAFREGQEAIKRQLGESDHYGLDTH